MTCTQPFPLPAGSFTVTRGDAWRQEFIFQNADETPLDLVDAGWQFWRSWIDGTPLDVDDSRAQEGVITLSMPESTSRNAKAGPFDMESVHPDLGTRTWIRGVFRFNEDVTK